MKNEFQSKGCHVVASIYSGKEIDAMLSVLNTTELENAFGVREILIRIPELIEHIFSENFKKLISEISPNCRTLIKSIYFDKPPSANWIVNWHQDLTINVEEKQEVKGYRNWRVLKDRVVVQPNVELLENIFTIRIHLDDCSMENGAVHVIEKSHQQGVIPIKNWIENKTGKEVICEVPKGGVMLMKPLTLHASHRTENNKNRRVIHLEFTDTELPEKLKWKEAVDLRDVRSNL